MIEIKKFKKEHCIEISNTEGFSSRYPGVDLAERAMHQAECGPASTIFLDGKPCVVGGIVSYWAGCGEGWAFFSPLVFKATLRVSRALKIEFNRLLKEGCFHRVQATCSSDNNQYCRFIEFLGFDIQGQLEKYYSDKTDAFLYEMVR